MIEGDVSGADARGGDVMRGVSQMSLIPAQMMDQSD